MSYFFLRLFGWVSSYYILLETVSVWTCSCKTLYYRTTRFSFIFNIFLSLGIWSMSMVSLELVMVRSTLGYVLFIELLGWESSIRIPNIAGLIHESYILYFFVQYCYWKVGYCFLPKDNIVFLASNIISIVIYISSKKSIGSIPSTLEVWKTIQNIKNPN